MRGPGLIWVRHPVTDAPQGLCYGHLDLGWGAGAEAQAKAAQELLPDDAPIWSSPLRRCRALADRLAAASGQAVILDDRLREMHFGQWEGQPWDAIDRAESDPWARDPWSLAPPGGEPFQAVYARVAAALADLPARAIVVTHAGVIRAARMIVTGAGFEAVFAEPIPYAHPMTFQEAG